MKYIKLIKYLLPLLIACKPAEVTEPTDVSEESTEISDSDGYSWATWETCGQKPGENPCNFALQDQHANTVELYEHYGKVIILDFSTMWCSVCHNIATTGDDFVTDYGEENVIWLTILIDNTQGNPPSQEDLELWVDLFGIELPVLAGSRDMLDETATEGYPISSWPTIVVVNKEMLLYNGINGWSETTVRGWVESLL